MARGLGHASMPLHAMPDNSTRGTVYDTKRHTARVRQFLPRKKVLIRTFETACGYNVIIYVPNNPRTIGRSMTD